MKLQIVKYIYTILWLKLCAFKRSQVTVNFCVCGALENAEALLKIKEVLMMRKIGKKAVCLLVLVLMTLVTIPVASAASESSNTSITIYYPNGDWGLTPAEIDINGIKDQNQYLYALKQLIEPTDLPNGCYDEFPSGFEVNDIDLKDGIAYIDVADEALLEKNFSSGWLATLSDIIGYTVFGFDRTIESIHFTTNGKANSILPDIEKKVLFAEPATLSPGNIKTIDIDWGELKNLPPEEQMTVVKEIIRKSLGEDKSRTYYTVCLDPGHGGSESGAVVGGVEEKNLNLSIGLAAKNHLELNGNITVVMTRTTDRTVSLGDRSKKANDNNADVFVNIHCNTYSSSSVRGCTARYPNNHDAAVSEVLGNLLISGVTNNSSIPKHSDAAYQSLQVLRNAQMPASLVECGFMTNSSDLSALQNEYTDIGNGLAVQIVFFLAYYV